MRDAGETPLPKTVYLDSAKDMEVPSRDPARTIPCRILRPRTTHAIKVVFLHIHGGGWVLQDHKSQDLVLQGIADRNGVLIISAGYRLAPENPFPAGPNDCYDVAEWLVDNATSHFGAPLTFVGGESAGGHLSMLVALHLLQHPQPQYSTFNLRGLLLHYGCYSLLWTPHVYAFQASPSLVLDRDLLDAFAAAFLPGVSDEVKRDPAVSPLYTDLRSLRGRLPSALFTCGTEDCLLDDTLFMSARWMVAGGETVLEIVPGAPHGYIMFPAAVRGSGADVGMRAVDEFLLSRLR